MRVGDVMQLKGPSFEIGQLVKHRRYGYRGVVAGFDPECRAQEAWYQNNRTQPKRDQPWYHVLVHGGEHATYAAQDSLEPYQGGEQVLHPLVRTLFESFSQGRYQARTGAHFPGLW